jgi:hypothetical protein
MIVAPLALARSKRSLSANVFLALDPERPPTLAEIERHLARVEPGVRVKSYQMIQDALAGSIRPRRITALVATTFAVGALTLVAIGLFGLVTQAVG